jgi:hypothetical protein
MHENIRHTKKKFGNTILVGKRTMYTRVLRGKIEHDKAWSIVWDFCER